MKHYLSFIEAVAAASRGQDVRRSMSTDGSIYYGLFVTAKGEVKTYDSRLGRGDPFPVYSNDVAASWYAQDVTP